MAFRNAGTPVWIGPGGTQSWSYGWGDDHGQEFASADMKTPGAEMVVVAESERKETGGAITYFVTFKNNGPQTPGQFRAGLIAGPGQKLHEVEVADDFPMVANPEEVHKKLAAHLHKKAA